MKSPFDRFLPPGSKARQRKSGGKAERLRTETLEQRLALAVDVFAQPTFTPIGSNSPVPGWVTVVGDASDDIFVQQVATASQALVVADNSSFLGPKSVANIDADYATIFFTNGRKGSASNVEFDNSPLYSTTTANQTRFALPLVPTAASLGSAADSSFKVFGTLRYTQDDGRVIRWSFDNEIPGLPGRFGQSLFLKSGPGSSGEVVPNGTVYPTNLAIAGFNVVFGGIAGPASLDVRWSSSLSSSPVIESITYTGREAVPTYSSLTGAFTGIAAGGTSPVNATNLNPSAPRTSTYTLRDTNGSQGIIPGTLSGVITDDKGNEIERFHSAAVFFGAVSPDDWMTTDIPLVFDTRQWTGSYNPAQGTVSISYAGQLYDRSEVRSAFLPADPGPLRVSANYALYSATPNPQKNRAGSLTFFAGQDITRQVVADLLAPGSTINVDSPLRVGSWFQTVTTTTSAGSLFGGLTTTTRTDVLASTPIQLRASNVNLNAEVQSRGPLLLGRPLDLDESDPTRGIPSATVIGDPLPSLITRNATAFASVSVSGQVTSITVPPGLGGAGYDPGNPPLVEIDGPLSVDAEAQVTGIKGGVDSITITDRGLNFPATGNSVILSPPNLPGGVQATAELVVVRGSIVEVNVLNRGSGYTVPPTVTITPGPVGGAETPPSGGRATAVISGEITGLQLISGGFGYAPRSTVNVVINGNGSGASATGTVQVDDKGSLTNLRLTNGGDRYRSDNTTVTFTPRVVNPPPSGINAVATADVDKNGVVTGIRIEIPGNGYGQTPNVRIAPPPEQPRILKTPLENVTVNSRVSAPVFDIRLSSDSRTVPTQVGPNGLPVEKGSMLVSPSGSLVATVGTTSAAASVFVQAMQSDVRVEGLIAGATQSYLMQSDAASTQFAPYSFTTRSRSGAAIGLIRGDTVGVTLGNDAETPRDDAVALNVCDLDTDIHSFRIRAAARDGGDRSDPFPYALSVREANDISFDAVASSSFPIDLRGLGSVAFTSAVFTAGDFVVNSGVDLTTQAPVSTSRGRILLNGGGSVSVQNGLSVGEAARVPLNAGRQDIVLNAQGGGMTIGGILQAPNNVSLVQRNGRFAGARRRAVAPNTPLLPGSTVSAALAIPDNFKFNDLNVEVNITHPSTRLLSLALIAPDGTRVQLARNVGSFSTDTANLTNTVFDSEAATSITGGATPFTGSFRPVEPLTALYGRSPQGTWRLEVRNDYGFTATGTTPASGVLNGFTLAFQADGNGVVSGSGRIVAGGLDIDTQASIGDSGQLPGDAQYFLRTDVDTLSARAGGSISIDEANSLNVTSLRAGGIVTLRANGADPAGIGESPRRPALKASLTDVPAMDLSAPNGSIDVVYSAPLQNVVLGNAKNLSLSQQAREGKVFSMFAAGSVDIRSLGGSSLSERLVVLDGPAAGSGARTVQGVASNALPGTYTAGTPGVFSSSISATVDGALTLPGVGNLVVGQRILVAGGTSTLPGSASNANGVYLVVDAGSASTRWRIVRSGDSDTAAEMPTNTFVRAQNGTGTPRFFQISYPAPTAFAATPILVTDVTARLKTNIGSDDPSDVVQFVVSTPDGTNTAPGSLGKMIDLRQSLDTTASPTNATQVSELLFSTGLSGPIRLSQQLPVIVKGFSIDGSKRLTPAGTTTAGVGQVVVDGSQISLTAGNSPVQAGDRINGFEFRGTGAANSVLANLTASGFINGAAVMVDGVPGMTITNATFGLSDTNDRLQNDYGIVVMGNSSNIQISGVTVASSRVAGIAILDSATGTTIVGSTIGASQRDNGTGVLFNSTGANSLGSASGARNFVRFNQTGVLLQQGVNVVINTEISNNTFDGVRVEGGTNAIGTAPLSVAAATTKLTAKNARAAARAARTARNTPAAKGTLSATSNSIFANGRWGVNFISSAVARLQRVAGNYLGSGLFKSTPGKNLSGNVGVAGGQEEADKLGYKANAKTGLDTNGNQHVITKAGPARSRVNVPWRARR